MAMFILCSSPLMEQKSLWAFCFSTFTARSEVLAVVTLRKNNICPYIRSKQAFFHISVRDTLWVSAFHWFGTLEVKGGGGPHLKSIAPSRITGVFHRSSPGPVPIPLSEPPLHSAVDMRDSPAAININPSSKGKHTRKHMKTLSLLLGCPGLHLSCQSSKPPRGLF